MQDATASTDLRKALTVRRALRGPAVFVSRLQPDDSPDRIRATRSGEAQQVGQNRPGIAGGDFDGRLERLSASARFAPTLVWFGQL
jgi:hypothetical protein